MELRARRSAASKLCAAVMAAIGLVGGGAAVAGASLPDNRGYELVSPADKNGADVAAESTRTRARADGDLVGFISLGGFGDTLGTGVAAEYMSARTGAPGTSGWTTHGLLPKVDPNSFNSASQAMDSTYQGEFSQDFSRGVLRTFTNLANDPNLVNVTSLYVRTDLSTPGPGTFQLLTRCAICSVPLRFSQAGNNPTFVAATADYSHMLFEARYNYTADAPAQPAGCLATGTACRPRLYELDGTDLRFVGVLPADEGGGDADFSVAGTGPNIGRNTLRTLSADGSRIVWTSMPNNGTATGPVYLRENHATTVRVSASERTDCDGDLTCGGDGIADPTPDPAGEQGAKYEIASTDASKVFFTTTEQLTDDDSDGGADLYMYDASLPASDPHNLTRISVDSEPGDVGEEAGVVGTSDDGSYVYFMDSSQLVAGQPLLVSAYGIFQWHAGVITYIGSVTGDDVVPNILGTPLGTQQIASRVTADGRHLLFTSHSGTGLTGYDQLNCGPTHTEGCSELYLYSADDGTLVCATCKPNSSKAASDAVFADSSGRGGAAATSHLSRPLSADGSHVFFSTGERLDPADRNGATRDVYEYDANTGKQLLLSAGTGQDNSYLLDASANGSDVFFATRDRLVGWDTDNSYDLYDARVGGGLPEPVLPAPECVGDTCQGSAVAPPGANTPSTADFFDGNDNVKPSFKKPAKKQCKKGRVRKRVHGKVRCVKKPKAKGKRAAAQRRGR